MLFVPWLWLAFTFTLLAAGSLVLYGGADYPGLFADFPGSLDAGSERDAAIDAWSERYFEIGLPFTIAMGAATVFWVLALRRRWLVVATMAAGAAAALTPLLDAAALVLVLFLLPGLALAVLPWQAVAAALLGVAGAAIVVKPPAERRVLHVAALYLAFSGQVIFTTLSVAMSRGTWG